MGSSVPLGDRRGWSVAVLKRAWSGLGAGLGHRGGLGGSWGALGAFLAVLGMILGGLGAGLGRS